MSGNLLLSSASIVAVDAVTGGINWALTVGIPMLLSVNLVIAGLIHIFRFAKYKGINLLAWAFAGVAILCICIEGILSYYQTKSLYLAWSVIVLGSILPVFLVLLFVHFRLKKGRNLEKTFHV